MKEFYFTYVDTSSSRRPSLITTTTLPWGKLDVVTCFQELECELRKIENRELEKKIKMLVTEIKSVRKYWLPKQASVDKVRMFCQLVAALMNHFLQLFRKHCSAFVLDKHILSPKFEIMQIMILNYETILYWLRILCIALLFLQFFLLIVLSKQYEC